LKAQIPKKQLNDALNQLERIIPNRSSNVALTQVLVQQAENGLTLSGTNTETDLEIAIAADVESPRAFVVPAQLWAQATKTLPGELVELSIKDSELTLSSGGATFKLQTGEFESYPQLSFPTHSDVLIDAKELSKSLAAVRYAAATEEYRAVFRGVQLELLPNRSRVVATDGFRLAYRDFAASNVTENGQKVVIPARNVDEIVRVLRDGEAKLTIGNGSLSVLTDRARLNVKLMDGELPDYERVIPKSFSVRLKLEVARLRESISRVAVVADKLSNNRVDFIVAGERLQLVAESDSGRAQDVLETTLDGDPGTTIGFRAKQLLEALGPMEGEVTVDLGASGAPAVFRASGDPNYLAIVVSLRI
jgi:DNA polymerase III subunit beta